MNRNGEEGWTFQATGGWGSMEQLDGYVQERTAGGDTRAGLSVDLEDLGLEDDFSSYTLGFQAYNRWFTFLVDYRHSSLEASGTANQDIRIEIDDVVFAGRSFDFQVIPAGVDYDIEANTQWLGVGARFTPITLNTDGAVRFTPWLHLGVQGITADYEVDAGAAVGIEVNGARQRDFVERGESEGSGEALIPEYGIGGELRVDLAPGEGKGVQLVAAATYKILDFEGALDSLGVDNERFEEIDFEYSALEANVYLQWPLSDAVDLITGVYLEQVDVSSTLDADERNGEVFNREVEFSYTLYALKAGLLF